MTALWTLTSTGTDFTNPSKKWDNVSTATATGSWNWDRSKVTTGDFTGDGKADVGILYDNGQTEDSRNVSALWTFTSTGSDFTNPSRKWDSGTGSWNADASKPAAGDFNGTARPTSACCTATASRTTAATARACGSSPPPAPTSPTRP